MAKTVNRKTNKKVETKPLEIKTPYPKDVKLPAPMATKKDVDFVGEELVKLSNRINELELNVNDMNAKVKQVSNRMGL